MPTEEELRKLKEASEESAEKARKLLDADVKAVMSEVARINELKPDTVDDETYNKLIEIVQNATNKNESIATLKENVMNLGESAISLLKEMAKIAKSLT